MPLQPSWKHSRPAPRRAGGKPPQISDDVEWTRIVEPIERYRIVYRDRNGKETIREIELKKVGTEEGQTYFGVMHEGQFKTLRADRVVQVLEQLTTGHPASIEAAPTYRTRLPNFPVEGAVYKVPTIAVSNRCWTVDLNAYVCSCPESRVRIGKGYKPGELGFVCPHVARAILEHLPAECGLFTPALRSWLADPTHIHIDNLR